MSRGEVLKIIEETRPHLSAIATAHGAPISDDARLALNVVHSVTSTAALIAEVSGVRELEVTTAIVKAIPLEAITRLLSLLRELRHVVNEGTFAIGNGIPVEVG